MPQTPHVAGGLIPLLPYLFISHTETALVYSVLVTALALVVYGAFRGKFTGAPILRSGF